MHQGRSGGDKEEMNIKTEGLGDRLGGDGKIRLNSQNSSLNNWMNLCHWLGWSCPLEETMFKGKMSTGRYLQDFQVQMCGEHYRFYLREKHIHVHS